MSNPKDYYQILGITTSADQIVIKAVYKALALKYHPDRNIQNSEYAAARMTEINEAYAVLSDEAKRSSYDQARRGSSEQDQFTEEPEDISRQYSDVEKQIDADWSVARKYFSDIDAITLSLSNISPSLVLPFKLTLLESQNFEDRHKIANSMENAYIQSYFGRNLEVAEFATYLLRNGRRDAASELNKAVRILGSKINPDVIILQLSNEFGIDYQIKINKDAEDHIALWISCFLVLFVLVVLISAGI